MLFSIIYFSKATKAMQDDELLLLLEESRNWNRTHSITGMLLHVRGPFPTSTSNEGRFIQVLEGPENEVRGIFEKIKTDKRHRQITLLKEAGIKRRNFSTWEMGFESLGQEEYKAKPGFFELNDDFAKNVSLQKLNIPLNFLKSFYSIHAKHLVK